MEIDPNTPSTLTGRRRFGVPTLVVAILATGLVAGGGAWLVARRGGHADPHAAGDAKEQWQCPMHPTIVQDHPGDCPICGMKLVKVAAAAAPEAKAGTSAPQKEQWQCPMHPSIVQDHPGDCPICGMKLVKVSAPGAGSGGSGERKVLFYRSPMDPKQTSPTPRKDEMGMDYVPVYSDEAAGDAAPVEGLATVNIDPARQQLIGLKTAAAIRGQVGGAWRTVGRVAADETHVRRVNIKIPAYVERIYVDFVGKPVRKGEPLFSVYSPELLSAQEEFVLAVRTQKTLSGAGGGLAGDGDSLVAAARRRLQLWDIPRSEIERLEKTGEPSKNLTIYSPISGVVTKKDVVEGTKLETGAMPYEIVDLSRVWVFADVYESEMRHVKLGMSADLTLNAYPNRVFKGRVEFVDPVLDPKTRTVRVRLAFANPTGELKPDMFGDVVLRGAARDGLLIPTDAVIDSGTSNVVFVAVGDGKFQPREVKLGRSDGQMVEVVSGVAEGEPVVTRANFLVDSESRLRASLAELTNKAAPTPAPATGQAGEGHAGHGGK